MSNYRVGFGYDEHLLKSNDCKVILGGHSILSKYEIVAHSDGDVVLHAITDAILGALGKDDIGTYFPDTDNNNKNRSSIDFYNMSLTLLSESKYGISNIDVTIVTDKIMLNNEKANIKNSIVKITNAITNIEADQLSIKATRFEDPKDIIRVYVSMSVYKK